MNRCSRARAVAFLFLAGLIAAAQSPPQDSAKVVWHGKAHRVEMIGKPWVAEQGALVAQGTGGLLRPSKVPGSGGSRATIRLSLDELDGTAAALQLSNGRLLFDARGGGIATEGSLFDPMLWSR